VGNQPIRSLICADTPRTAERHAYLPSFQILVASFLSLPTFTHDDIRFTVLRTKRPRPTPALVRAAISA
jgi:hypothetical protein